MGCSSPPPPSGASGRPSIVVTSSSGCRSPTRTEQVAQHPQHAHVVVDVDGDGPAVEDEGLLRHAVLLSRCASGRWWVTAGPAGPPASAGTAAGRGG